MIPTDHDIAEVEINEMLQRQRDRWTNAIKYGAGNPFATLCDHCHGRHPPPRDEMCPNKALDGHRSKYGLRVKAYLESNNAG